MKKIKSKQLFKNLVGGTFSEDQAKFITVGVLEALRVVHGSGMVHRDIKPDNIIIDANGYPKLTDFGIAEFEQNIVSGSQYGTLSYMAPEIIFEHSYSYTVDYYSLGVLLLLMVSGDMLSVGSTHKEAKKNISLRKDSITTKKFSKRYPYLSEECLDLIVSLLTTSQHQRIGSRNKIDEILQHIWFEDIDIKSVQDQTLDSPIYDLATCYENIEELTSFNNQKIEEDYYWMLKEKKAMRMISKSLVDYGNFWKSNFAEFMFIKVETNEEEDQDRIESSNTMLKHAMSSIQRKRKESLSQIMDRVSLTGTNIHLSDTTRISSNKSGLITNGNEVDFKYKTVSPSPSPVRRIDNYEYETPNRNLADATN